MRESTSAETARSIDHDTDSSSAREIAGVGPSSLTTGRSNSDESSSVEESTYDYDGTLERLGGDVELFVDLVRFFLEDAAMLQARMETALEAKDARTVEITAHSLKGLCSNFGARRAVAAAYAIEESARAGKLADAPNRAAQFKDGGRPTDRSAPPPTPGE